MESSKYYQLPDNHRTEETEVDGNTNYRIDSEENERMRFRSDWLCRMRNRFQVVQFLYGFLEKHECEEKLGDHLDVWNYKEN